MRLRLSLAILAFCSFPSMSFAGPEIVVKNGRIVDLGDVWTGSVIHYEYLIANTGDADLSIIGISKNCNCTEVQPDNHVIAPGDSSVISIEIDTIRKKGETSADIVLETNTEQRYYFLKLLMNCIPEGQEKAQLTNRVKKAARSFRKRHARNAISRMRYTYAVTADDRYVEFVGYDGYVYLTDFTLRSRRAGRIKDRCRNLWYPTSGMCSYAWDVSGSDTLPSRSVSFPGQVSLAEQLSIQYNDRPNVRNITDYIRMVEVCSPLNPRYTNRYEYWPERSDNPDYLAVGFRTKEEAFPKRVRLNASGEMFFDIRTGRVIKMTVRNWIDYWTSFPYRRMKGIPQTLTTETLEIGFQDIDNETFLDYADLKVQWKDRLADGATYYVSVNRRRKPCDNRLKEHQYIKYYDQTSLSKKLPDKVIIDGELGYFSFYAPYDSTRWSAYDVPWLNWPILERDLFLNGESLKRQAELSSFQKEIGGYTTQDSDAELRLRNQLLRSTQIIKDAIKSPEDPFSGIKPYVLD